MTPSRRGAPLLALVLSCIAPFSAWAEIVVCGMPLDPDSPLGWKSAKAAAGQRGFEAAKQILRDRYREAALEWPGSVATPAAEAFAALDAGREKIANFEITKSGTNPLTLKQGVFHGQSYFVELPIEAESPLCSPPALKKARIEFANVITGFGDAEAERLSAGAREISNRIAELEQQFDRYLFEGFPMFPWEAAVNSWFLTKERVAAGPPRDQIVLLHPAAGLVVSVDQGTRSDTGATLSIEPIGWVRYAKDYRHWMGISALAVFPADREAGYGVAFNYDMFKLGVTWHDDDEGDHDGAAIFVGLDLYRFIDSKYREYDRYRDRVHRLASE